MINDNNDTNIVTTTNSNNNNNNSPFLSELWSLILYRIARTIHDAGDDLPLSILITSPEYATATAITNTVLSLSMFQQHTIESTKSESSPLSSLLTKAASSSTSVKTTTMERRKEGWTERFGAYDWDIVVGEGKRRRRPQRSLRYILLRNLFWLRSSSGDGGNGNSGMDDNGDDDGNDDDDDNNDDYNNAWDTEVENTQCNLPSLPSQCVTLTQHRIAWREQLLLRAHYIPHTIVNSSRSSSIIAGPMPHLLHFPQCATAAATAVTTTTAMDCSSNSNSNSTSNREGDNNNDNGIISSSYRDDENQSTFTTIVGRLPHPSLRLNISANLDSSCMLHNEENRNSTTYNNDDYIRNINDNNNDNDNDNINDNNNNTDTMHNNQNDNNMASNSTESIELCQRILRDLERCLLSLRYGDDINWQESHKPRSIHARSGYHNKDICSGSMNDDDNGEHGDDIHNNGRINGNGGGDGDSGSNTSIIRYFQARVSSWAERTYVKHYIIGTTMETMTLDTTIHHSKRCYDILEERLKRNTKLIVGKGDDGLNHDRDHGFVNLVLWNSQHQQYSTSSQQRPPPQPLPDEFDAALFEHLSEALSDPHLAPIISTKPYLMAFHQFLNEAYFGHEYQDKHNDNKSNNPKKKDSNDWIRRNNLINANNAFFIPQQHLPPSSLPSIIGTTTTLGGSIMAHHRNHVTLLFTDDAAAAVINNSNNGNGNNNDIHTNNDNVNKTSTNINMPIAASARTNTTIPGLLRQWWHNAASIGTAEEEAAARSNQHRGWWQRHRRQQQQHHDQYEHGHGSPSNNNGKGGTNKKQQQQQQQKQKKEDPMEERNRKNMEHMIREAKSNDELWISGVIALSVVGFVVSLSRNK